MEGGLSNAPITWTDCKVKLSDLKKWDDNPAEITKEAAGRLAESFTEFGQAQVILIEPDYTILDGHQRDDVWGAKFGADFVVDCRMSSRKFTKKERQKFVVFLREGATGRINWDEIANWEVAPGELQSWGLDEAKIKEWNTGAAALNNFLESEKEPPADAEAQTDRAAELQEIWQVKRGDLWQIGEHRLLCGDSTLRADVERVMGGEQANLLMTSPPYWVGKDYETQESEKEIDDFVSAFCDSSLFAMSDDYSRIVINTGVCRGSSLSDEKETRVILLLDKYINSYFRNEWKLRTIRHWIKGGGQPRPRRPVDDVVYFGIEYLLTFYKSKSKSRGQNILNEKWVQQSNWMDVDGDRQENEAGFSMEIPSRFISLYSLENEIVYEPFCGNGTTGIACQNLGRRARMIEISPEYCSVILQRFADAFPSIKIERIKSGTAVNG